MRFNKAGEVVFDSLEPFYVTEEDGRKPNTVRLLSQKDWDALWEWHNGNDEKNKPSRIRIVCAVGKISIEAMAFVRDLTDITCGGRLLGKRLVILSWRHPEEVKT